MIQRFTGPQILKFRRTNAGAYEETSRISLASSFFASLFLGKVAPIDISDVCGMNLWDIPGERWSDQLLEIVGGDSKDMRSKLGEVAEGGAHLGPIHSYFVKRYGFSKGAF
jgi:xylulokinase